jgi:preprotein translocase subunit SecG
MITAILTIIHVAVCLILIMVVLLQTGKRADLAGAFGGGGSQTAFGARGAATLLSRVTTWCAVLFMVTSLLLALRASSRQEGASVVEGQPQSAPVQTPAEQPPVSPAGTSTEDPAPPDAGDPAPEGN